MFPFIGYPDPMVGFTRAWYCWMLFAQLDSRGERAFFTLPE